MKIEIGAAMLVRLCPALQNRGTARTLNPGPVILRSRADEVNPFASSIEFVSNSGPPVSTLIEVGQDHRLADAEALGAFVWAAGSKAAQNFA